MAKSFRSPMDKFSIFFVGTRASSFTYSSYFGGMSDIGRDELTNDTWFPSPSLRTYASSSHFIVYEYSNPKAQG
ncbi:hypothetical protein LTR42_000991 [Elasticomyces elasticus]|nr:hypothetical protein LTR42_000991 [Elasticomyces elasticus]